MRRNRFVVRGKILPVIWSAIILGAVYLLIRFAALSFSGDVGQATGSIKEAIISSLCVKVMESGSSFISYSSNDVEEAYSFPVNLVANTFILHEFIKDNSPKMAMARENSFLWKDDYLLDTSVQEATVTNNETIMEESDNEGYKEGEADNEGYKKQETIGYYDIAEGILSKEYILTNGAMFGSSDGSEGFQTGTETDDSEYTYLDQLQIGILEGGIDNNSTKDNAPKKENEAAVETINTDGRTNFTLEQLKNMNFLVNNFYIVDPDTKVSESLFNSEVMLDKDMTIKQENDVPQILIYHTHSQEAFIDSREGVEEDTVIGVGTYLTEILEDQYGYNVIHDKSKYDIANGELDRNKAYNYARTGIEKILEDNPTIEVVIDLHRDGVLIPANKRVITLNGKETAQIMLYNGLCRDQNGPLTRLDNPYQEDNLAFSLQLQLKSLDLYPALFYKNYLNAYRYNQHVRAKTILMELGTNYNTLQSEKNAMEPFAKILDSVLQGK